MRYRYLLVAAAMTLSACSSPEVSEEAAPVLTLHEVARYGSRGGEGSALTRPVGLVSTDSTVLILEADPPRIALFRNGGEWLQDWSRAGDGPGELRQPSHLGRVGNEVWVGDPRGGRLETFGMDGTPEHSYRWDVEPDSLGVRTFPTALFHDGSVLAGPAALSIGAAATGRSRHRSYYRTDLSGRPLSTLYREVLDSADFFAVDLSSGSSIVGMSELRSSPLVAPLPDGSGIVVVERPEATEPEATFRLRLITSTGSDELDREIEYHAVSAETWLDQYISRVEQDMLDRGGAVDRDVISALRSGIVKRRYHPPVSRLRAGDDGSIWLRREEFAQDSVEWHLFTRSGELVGSLKTAKETDIIGGSGTDVWTVELDDWDVPFVIHSRILR